jgi:hypothetical protein
MRTKPMAVDSVLDVQFGPLHVDVPRTVGSLCGIAAADGAGLIEPPPGIFIAAAMTLHGTIAPHHLLERAWLAPGRSRLS